MKEDLREDLSEMRRSINLNTSLIVQLQEHVLLLHDEVGELYTRVEALEALHNMQPNGPNNHPNPNH